MTKHCWHICRTWQDGIKSQSSTDQKGISPVSSAAQSLQEAAGRDGMWMTISPTALRQTQWLPGDLDKGEFSEAQEGEDEGVAH